MARVEWTRQEGDDIEAVVGMFICSDFPNAVRVRPSQGDGGVDIFVPGPQGFAKQRAVYQVKKFYSNLTSSQKRKITRSFENVVAASSKEGWEITEWHLVMPLDVTDHNLANWLKKLTAGAEFRCETHGLLYCDTKAAQYRKVVDYYMRDGKERLQAAVDDLTAIIARRVDRQPNEPLVATDVMTDLASIYNALNDHDPFYRYEFGVSDSPPAPNPSSAEPGLVGVHATRHDSVWIAIKIFALSLESLRERPIGGQLQFSAPEDDDELGEQFQKFIDYGAPVTMPPGTVSGSLDLPGGLGGELQGASLQVLAAPEGGQADPAELALAIVEPDSDTVIASTTIRRIEQSAGQAGVRSVFADQADLFTLEMLVRAGHLEGSMNLDVEYNLEGRRPGQLIDSLKVLSAWQSPNRLAFGRTYGPSDYGVVATIPTDGAEDSGNWAQICEALAQLQNHVSVLLKMPAEMSRDEALDIIFAAKLVSGQAVPASKAGPYTVHHEGNPPQIARDAALTYEFVAIRAVTISLAGQEFAVGKEALFLLGRYTEIEDGHSTIEPLSDGVSVRYTGELEATRVLARFAQEPIGIEEPAGGEAVATDRYDPLLGA
ncbi:hypothetical protein [Candidatus Mycobacterium methanotrophicum]|uniref:Restriction endonuclease type IV Mrr domain-containing protein n=1 Tax=Candidatus Mycobacterium methanotrophicum TaxID=2943498 RepID=A0ABY4QEW1_9MYCO|nr:hypothetical protein [Candidatus Mycobacterium methanotrophicum]UQX09359.1 hypothetical protein M5I08_13035 [Candidatus Mycobacterium methanotrophicum]